MDDMDSQEATQQATQHAFDPRRQGQHNSGLREQDVADVICILHPASSAALQIVAETALMRPQHILQNGGILRSEFNAYNNGDPSSLSDLETILASPSIPEQARDLALRFSSKVQDPVAGFCFGRNQTRCDINLDPGDTQKRVSNLHFHIFLNASGILMLEDTSTNGTVVDGVTLGSKRNPTNPKTRLLTNSSIIEILSPNPDDVVKFIVRIPARDGHQEEYRNKFRAHVEHVIATEQARAHDQFHRAGRGAFTKPGIGPPHSRAIAVPEPLANSHHGMRWDGNGLYRPITVLGKGAFAIVYQVARNDTGEVFAAKELEKKRFVKNGQLDTRLDNEMQIMKSLRHHNIVQYIDYHETDKHLYIIMEYVPYGDVQGYISTHGTLKEDLARNMTRQIFDALAYLHRKNITHRDIKPDNILIWSEDPFEVKLTDFGLSKVVKNNETFLKTFCGTLLYCAPEVFPHYDNYVAGKRAKRRRKDGNAKDRHYSQLVDIWSYAAVLWFVLCGKPPYEGVMDANGRAMFTKIMETSLDATPLRQAGVSDDAIDLLLRMLDTDPASRPSEVELLNHAWLNGGITKPSGSNLNGLSAIQEHDEELDASQLSIMDKVEEEEEEDNDPLLAQSSGETGSPIQKRFKASEFVSPALRRQQPLEENKSYQSVDRGSHLPFNGSSPPQQGRTDKLFGEISGFALKSSGTLGHANAQDMIQAAQTQKSDDSLQGSWDSFQDDMGRQSYLADKYQPTRSLLSDAEGDSTKAPGASLSGAVTMVKELHMESAAIANPAQTEFTVQYQTPAQSQAQAMPVTSQEDTPKPKPFNRQIEIPGPTMDIFGRSERVGNESHGGTTSMPDTAAVSLASHWQNQQSSANDHRSQSQGILDNPSTDPQDMIVPSRLLGRLHSTPESFIRLDIEMTARITTWGRTPSNTHVYENGNDTRVPKIAFEIWFHAPSLSASARSPPAQISSVGSSSSLSGDDGRRSSPMSASRSTTASIKSIADANTTFPAEWLSQCSDLQAFVRTQSKAGIWINGVHLPHTDPHGRRYYGRLQHGDEILVSNSKDGSVLRFVVEMFFGQTKQRRLPGERGFVVAITDV